MNVGFIVECGKDGAETQVIPHLVQMLNSRIKPVVVPLDDKPRLIAECGDWAQFLLTARGCTRVVISWDLLPDWGETGCRHDDKAGIRASLAAAGLKASDRRIRLVCIEKMLEAWLISDERAIGEFLSTKEHPVRIRRQKKPANIRDPKAAMTARFRNSKSRINRYIDYDHAIQIATRLPDLERLRKCPSFAYFEKQLGHFTT